MNRVIKFRAWDGTQMLTMPLENNFGISRFFGILPDNANVMQFTGLSDKNGKDIYEGDIVQEATYSGQYNPSTKSRNENKFNYVVEYMIDSFCTKCLQETGSKRSGEYYGFYDTSFEVIGNIYENPELLNS